MRLSLRGRDFPYQMSPNSLCHHCRLWGNGLNLGCSVMLTMTDTTSPNLLHCSREQTRLVSRWAWRGRTSVRPGRTLVSRFHFPDHLRFGVCSSTYLVPFSFAEIILSFVGAGLERGLAPGIGVIVGRSHWLDLLKRCFVRSSTSMRICQLKRLSDERFTVILIAQGDRHPHHRCNWVHRFALRQSSEA